jgi:hypothetical protein
MSNELKKNELLKLFSCFPSANTIDREQAAIMTAAYLETLSKFSSETVSAACRAMRERSSPFPPSSGEVYAECERIANRQAEDRRWRGVGSIDFAKLRLPPPKRPTFTVEQMADWNLLINHMSPPYCLRANADGLPLKIPHGYPGAGQEVVYGYLTPSEAAWVKENRSRKTDARDMCRRYGEAAE